MRISKLMLVLTALVASSSLAGASALAAQAADEERLRGVLEDLSPSTRVEITAPGLWIQDGRVQEVQDDSVHVMENGLLVPVGLGEIESVAVERDHMLLGAAAGAAGGVLVGWSFGYLGGSFGCDTPEACNREGSRAALIGAAGLGVVGAIAGGLFGRSLGGWKSVFP